MHDRNSEKVVREGLATQVLIWGGVLLLLSGGLLTYPYVSSRLAAVPTAPIFTPPLPSPISSSPTATTTSTVSPTPTPAHAVAIAQTPTPAHTHTPEPTPSPLPTPTPAPPTRIVIPSIKVDAPVIPISWLTIEVNGQGQAAWDVPDRYAAGWHGTSAPLGTYGNTVLNGHNTTNGEVFRDLYTLKAGDTVVVYSDDIPYSYAVAEVLILPEADQPLEVRIENARYVLPTEDERLTLVTCHPYGSLRNRLIVIAHPAVDQED